jgi:hypothetical protein
MRGYAKEIEGYKKKQALLRQQLRRLKSGEIGAGGKTLGTDTLATIQRIERQIADLDKTIARLREIRGPT